MTLEEAVKIYLGNKAKIDELNLIGEALGSNLVKTFNSTLNSAIAVRIDYMRTLDPNRKKELSAAKDRVMGDIKKIVGGDPEYVNDYACGWRTNSFIVEFNLGTLVCSIQVPNYGKASTVEDVINSGFGKWTICVKNGDCWYTKATGMNEDELKASWKNYEAECESLKC